MTFMNEIEKLVLALKNNKVTSINQMTAELLTTILLTSAKRLPEERLPEEWLLDLIVELSERGELSECFTLLFDLTKKLTKGLLHRVSDKL